MKRADSHRLSLSNDVITPPSTNSIAAPKSILIIWTYFISESNPLFHSFHQQLNRWCVTFLRKGSYPEPVEMTDVHLERDHP